MAYTDKVFYWIEQERLRQQNGLELIASENFVSPAVLKAMGSWLTNKYAEGYPGKRYYGGCKYVDEVEELARERAKKLFGAEHVNVQPHSGAQANFAVMLAVLEPGDTILGFDLAHGGHLTHGSPVNYSGILYNTVFYGVDKNTGTIDYNLLEDQAKKHKPKLIIAGASAYSRDWDYKTFREIADKVGAVLMADIAHPAGLIAKKLLNDPLKYCHIVTTTTHKTLRGPRGGMILIGQNTANTIGKKTKKGKLKKWSTLIDSAVFPGTQGGPLMHVIAAKAVAFGEALQDSFLHYAKQVIKNAKTLANELIKKDYKIISGGTDNHLMLIDLTNKNITGKEAEDALEKAGITVNKNMIPFDTRPPKITSGIRIGTPAITTRGMKEPEMIKIAELIDTVITNHKNPKIIDQVAQEVNKLVQNFPLPYEKII